MADWDAPDAQIEGWLEEARIDLTDPDAPLLECDPRNLVRVLAAARAEGAREAMERAAKIIDRGEGADWDCCVETCRSNANAIRAASKEAGDG